VIPERLLAPAKVHAWLRHEEERIAEALGGPARLKVIVVLASVIGLEAADLATVGAVATPLERALHISNTDVGLLVTVSTAIGVFATLPVGVLVDRTTRTRLLVASILLWSAAELAGAAAQSYIWLLITRLALGAVVATAGPTVSSLVGDFFRVSERGRIWGFILTGELVGAGLGVLVSGDLGAITWRASFAWLVLPGVLIALAIWRLLPEPARGGQSRLAPGAEEIASAEDVASGEAPEGSVAEEAAGEEPEQGIVEEEVAEQGISPRRSLVLHRDPTGRDLWWAVRYVLAIPTNRLLIVASALGYFYFQGLRTFAVEFLRGRYGLGQAGASSLLVLIGLGAIAGALVTGRLADRLIRAGQVSGRVLVAGVAFLVSVGLLVAGLLTTTMAIGVALFFVGAAALGGANPPLDAARLDIMHSRLWGRAESVRTVLRASLEAVAPLLFGYVSDQLGGHTTGLGHPAGHASRGAVGLDLTLILMLSTVLAAGAIMLVTRRTYPRDVATAMASEQATAPSSPTSQRAA